MRSVLPRSDLTLSRITFDFGEDTYNPLLCPTSLGKHLNDLLVVADLPEAERCCGAAGIYNLLHPELSLLLRQAKIDHTVANGARIMVTANPGCQLYLQAGIRQAGLDVEVLHLAEVLVRAYGTRPGG